MLEKDWNTELSVQELYTYDYFAMAEVIPQPCDSRRFIRMIADSFRIRKHWINAVPEDIQ